MIIGWDTETDQNGKVILLANSNHQYIYDDSKPLRFWEMIDFFYLYGKGHSNYFYNIKYDWESICRNMDMPFERNVKFISWMNRTANNVFLGTSPIDGNKYYMKYIKKKLFNFQRTGHNIKQGINFYDIMSFTKGPLNDNGIKYLNMGKDNFDVSKTDYEKLNSDGKYLLQYIEYCIKDCILVRDLTIYFKKLYDEYTKKPLIGPPSIAGEKIEAHLKKNKLLKNYYIPFKFNRLCLDHLQFGRFEDIYKGTFDKCYNYDINSAYPFCIKQLKQLTGIITNGYEFDKNDINEFYGIYEISILPFTKFITPLMFRLQTGNVLCPQLDKKIFYTLNYYDLLLLKESGVRFEVNKVVKFHHNGKPIFDFISDMYDKRLKLKQSNNDQEQSIKRILNSMFGKMLQMRVYYNESPDGYIPFDNKMYEILYFPGKVFQPLFSGYIPSHTRYLLYKACHNENVISYATDGIYTTKELNLPVNNHLGGWEFEERGNSIFVKSGIRKVGDKINARGYYRLNTEKKFLQLLKDKIWKQIECIPVHQFMKWGIKVHTFQTVQKGINFNNDTKRIFPHLDSDDLLSKHYIGKPFTINYESLPYKNDITMIMQREINDLQGKV